MNGTRIQNNYIVITILVKNKKKLLKNLLNELDTEITIEEIIKTAKKIKSKKAAHSDKINNEMIKYSVDILIPMVL